MDEELRNYLSRLLENQQKNNRLSIVKVANQISEERKKQVIASVVVGICGIASFALFCQYGPSFVNVVDNLNSLTSLSEIKDYLSSLSPDFFAGVAAGAISEVAVYVGFLSFVKHLIKEKKAKKDFKLIREYYCENDDISYDELQMRSR